MIPVGVPDAAKLHRPGGTVVLFGPPAGVDKADCGDATILIDPAATVPGITGQGMFAYFRPTAEDLATLQAGGLIEFGQFGNVLQPFAASIIPAGE